MTASEFFSEEKQAAIVLAVEEAEKNTSGEIRVHIENSCKSNVLDRAAYIFKYLDMHKTALRNGVLFYLAIKDRKFAILGDVGINSKVPKDFWNEVNQLVLQHFKEEKFTIGLTTGIKMAGEKLKEHFPYQSNDINELSDEISFG